MQTSVRWPVLVATMVLWAAPAGAQVRFQLVKQLDMAALAAAPPVSVAAYGTHLYAGSLGTGGRLYHIVDPLGSPGPAVTFGGLNDSASNGGIAGPGTTTNGYVSLYTDGVTLVAATNNGGSTPDIAQTYLFGTETLNWGGNSGPDSLNTQTYRVDGAAVDPISGNVMTTGWAGDAQNFYSSTVAAPVFVPDTNILYYDPGVKTGWRDISYDHSTGDIYLRAANGIASGKRVADGRFVTLNGTTPGIQTIVSLVNPLASAINVEYLPSGFAGQPLVIMNDRENKGTSFADIVKTFSTTPPTSAPTRQSPGGVATTTPVAVSFVYGDGVTPFTTTDATSGIYDFSYNPTDSKLYVSDFSTSQIHVFGLAPQIIVIDVASDTQTQGQAGYPTLSGSIPVVKTGAGTLVLDQANTLTGSTTVMGGRLQLANGSALGSSWIVPLAGGTLTLAPGLQTTVGGLGANAGGLTDLGNGFMTVAAGLSRLDMLTALATGRGDGSWNGTSGISSSNAQADLVVGLPRTVGWLDNGDGSVSVAYAAPGDTNLDWTVDILDAANILAGGKFDSGTPASWNEGDFDYDGVVDIIDVADFLSTGLFNAGPYNPPSPGGDIAAVPEPAAATMIAAGVVLAAILRRSRMRCTLWRAWA